MRTKKNLCYAFLIGITVLSNAFGCFEMKEFIRPHTIHNYYEKGVTKKLAFCHICGLSFLISNINNHLSRKHSLKINENGHVQPKKYPYLFKFTGKTNEPIHLIIKKDIIVFDGNFFNPTAINNTNQVITSEEMQQTIQAIKKRKQKTTSEKTKKKTPKQIAFQNMIKEIQEELEREQAHPLNTSGIIDDYEFYYRDPAELWP